MQYSCSLSLVRSGPASPGSNAEVGLSRDNCGTVSYSFRNSPVEGGDMRCPKKKTVICPKCGRHPCNWTGHDESRERYGVICSWCDYGFYINLNEYNLKPECPCCGEYIYDPRGNHYAKIMHDSLGHCARPGCYERYQNGLQKQRTLDSFHG